MTTVCVFNFECGGGVCVDNECHEYCDGTCPVGQECLEGICKDLVVVEGECVFDEDCGAEGFRCINATCHPTCADDDGCGDGEACISGVCRVDVSPIRACADEADCDDGMSCILGICRLPCVAPVNCDGRFSECSEGFCHSLAELEVLCLRADDCAVDASCINGQCAFF